MRYTFDHAKLLKHLHSFSEESQDLINFCSDAFGSAQFAESTVEEMKGWIIRGVEIFKAGTYRGLEYTEDDLEQMADNFKKLKKAALFEPVFKLNHSEDIRDQVGWIHDAYVDGDILMADIHITDWLTYDKIKDKTWKYVSAEIYPPSLTEEEFSEADVDGYVLRGVAIVSVPKVKGLKGIILNSEILENNEEGNIMNREQVIALLAKAGINFSEEELKDLTDEQLAQKLQESFESFAEKANNPEGSGEGAGDKEKNKKPAAAAGAGTHNFGENMVVMSFEDVRKLSQYSEELEGKVENFSEEINKLKAKSKADETKNKVDALVRAGKILPAEKADILAFAEKLDDEAAKQYFEQLEKRPQIVEFAEVGGSQSTEDDDEIKAMMAELNKTTTFE